MNFGGVIETVVTNKEFSLEKAHEVLKNETIAVLGYGIQGPGQACNLRDNGFQRDCWVSARARPTTRQWLTDGAGRESLLYRGGCREGTVICMLLSDAGQIQVWPKIKKYLTKGKTLYYSHALPSTGTTAPVWCLQRMWMSSWWHQRDRAPLCAPCSARDVA